MKKIILVLFIIFNALLNLTSEVYLNFASSNNDPERKAVIRYLFDAFELYYPGIIVNIVSFEDGDRTDQILKNKNDLYPHMIMADSVLLSGFLSEGSLDIRLTSEILMELGIEDFYKGSYNAFSTSNGYFGIPYSAWLQVLWYRTDWFKKEGAAPPETLEALYDSSNLFYKPEENKYGIIIGSKNDEYLRQCFLHISHAAGLELEYDSLGCHFDKTVVAKSMDIYKELLRFTPPHENFWRSRDYYFQNRAAMLFYSTHLMDDLALSDVAADSLTGNNFFELEGADYSYELLKNTGMITTIFGSRPSSFGSVSGIGLFKTDDSEIQDAQKKLVQFLFQIDVYTTWLHMSPGGMLPVRRSVLEEDSFYRDSGGVFKRFGREKLIELTSGIENLNIINPECLQHNKNDGYEENDFREVLYQLLYTETPEILIDSVLWIR